MKTTCSLATIAAILFVSVFAAPAFAQTGRPDLSQLPSGSNNMFPPIPNGGFQPSAPAAPTPMPTSYSAPAAPAPTNSNQPVYQGQFGNSIPGQQQNGTMNGGAPNNQVPFDPSQFRQFNPQQFPGPARTLPPQEEKFVPSEVVSGLPPASRSSDLRAVLRTTMGDITIKLDKIHAPMTVQHFVALARGDKEFIDVKTSKRVKKPFYNGLIFHRVVKNFLVQTGCPFGNGRGGPGDIAMIGDEIKPMMKFDRPGIVAMAPMREGNGTIIRKDSNGSQFFISLKEMPEWDGKFTILGEVEEGMDVVTKISNVKVGPTERPIKRIYLTAVDIFEGTGDQQQQVPPVAPPNPDQVPPAQ